MALRSAILLLLNGRIRPIVSSSIRLQSLSWMVALQQTSPAAPMRDGGLGSLRWLAGRRARALSYTSAMTYAS